MIQFRVRYGQLLAQRRAAHRRIAAARAVWMALAVPLAAFAVGLMAGRRIALPYVAAAAVVVFVVAVAWAAVRSEPLKVRALDRRFGLDELLVTAFEVDVRGPRTALEAQLLDDAAARLAAIPPAARGEPERLWVELETAAALALIVFGGSIVVDRLWPRPLPAALGPAFGARAIGPDGAGGRPPAGRSDGGSAGPDAAERALAAALRDQGIAQAVARSLAGGDAQSAAQALRSMAERTRDLSPAGRQDLATALDAARRSLQPIDPALAAAAGRAGEGLRAPTPPADALGLTALADALASRAVRARPPGAAPIPPGTADAMGRAAATSGALAGGGGGGIAAEPGGDGAPSAERVIAPAPVRGGGAPGTGSAAADGIGAVPMAQRETVRRYFARDGAGARDEDGR